MAYNYDQPETYPEATRRELIEAASRGRGGQGAVVEAMFRLMDSIDAQERATKRLNRWLLAFTIAICVLTLALCFLTGWQVYLQLHQR
jgi:hypothetical protein